MGIQAPSVNIDDLRTSTMEEAANGIALHNLKSSWEASGYDSKRCFKKTVFSPLSTQVVPNMGLDKEQHLSTWKSNSPCLLFTSAWIRNENIIYASRMQTCDSFLTQTHLSAKLHVSQGF